MSDQPRCGDCRWWTETAPDLADGMCHLDPAGARTLRSWWCSHLIRRRDDAPPAPAPAEAPGAVVVVSAAAVDPAEAARRAVPPITPRNGAGRPKGRGRR